MKSKMDRDKKDPTQRLINKHRGKLQLGGLYELKDGRLCELKYIGTVHFTKGEMLGLEIVSDEAGRHDGEYDNVRYFKCPEGKGIFKRPKAVATRARDCRRKSGADGAISKFKPAKYEPKTKEEKPKHKRKRSLGPRDFKKDPTYKPYKPGEKKKSPSTSVEKPKRVPRQRSSGPRDIERDRSWRPYRSAPPAKRMKVEEVEKKKKTRHIRKRSLGPRDFPKDKHFKPYVFPPMAKNDKNPSSPRVRQLGPRDFKRDPSFGKDDKKKDPTKAQKIRKVKNTEKTSPSTIWRTREERRPGNYRPDLKYKPYKPSDTKEQRTKKAPGKNLPAKTTPHRTSRTQRSRNYRDDRKYKPYKPSDTKSSSKKKKTRKISKVEPRMKHRSALKAHVDSKMERRKKKASVTLTSRTKKKLERAASKKARSPLPEMLGAKTQAKVSRPSKIVTVRKLKRKKTKEDSSDSDITSGEGINKNLKERKSRTQSSAKRSEKKKDEETPRAVKRKKSKSKDESSAPAKANGAEFQPLPHPHITNVKGQTPLEILSKSSPGNKIPDRTTPGLKVVDEVENAVSLVDVTKKIMESSEKIMDVNVVIQDTERVAERVDIEVFGGVPRERLEDGLDSKKLDPASDDAKESDSLENEDAKHLEMRSNPDTSGTPANLEETTSQTPPSQAIYNGEIAEAAAIAPVQAMVQLSDEESSTTGARMSEDDEEGPEDSDLEESRTRESEDDESSFAENQKMSSPKDHDPEYKKEDLDTHSDLEEPERSDAQNGSKADKFVTLDGRELMKKSSFQELRKYAKDTFGWQRKFTTKKKLIEAIIAHNIENRDKAMEGLNFSEEEVSDLEGGDLEPAGEPAVIGEQSSDEGEASEIFVSEGAPHFMAGEEGPEMSDSEVEEGPEESDREEGPEGSDQEPDEGPEESDQEAPEESDHEPEMIPGKADVHVDFDSEDYLEALEKAAEEEMKSLESIDIDDVVEKSLEQEAEEEMQSLSAIDLGFEEEEKSPEPVQVMFGSASNLDDIVDDTVFASKKKVVEEEDLSFKRISIQNVTHRGMVITVDVNAKTTIYEVKRQVWLCHCILVVAQVLSYRKRVLSNDQTIRECGVLKKNNRALKLEVKNIQKVENWSVTDVCAWCSVHPQLRLFAPIFEEHGVSGLQLLALSEQECESMGIQSDEQRNEILKAIQLLKQCFLMNERQLARQKERAEIEILSLKEAVKLSRRRKPTLKDWTPKRTVQFMNAKKKLKKYSKLWIEHSISGERLIELGENDLIDMGISSAGDRKTILSIIAKVKSSQSQLSSPRSPREGNFFLSANENAI